MQEDGYFVVVSFEDFLLNMKQNKPLTKLMMNEMCSLSYGVDHN